LRRKMKRFTRLYIHLNQENISWWFHKYH